MSAGTDRKVVLVTRKTRLDELVARYHSIAQARFYLEHLGADFADYLREHETYLKAKESALAVIARFQRRQVTDRHFLPNFLFGPDDIMIALGQDGLVANTMKYLDGQPLVGVNPDPARYDGILLPFQTRDLAVVLPAVALRQAGCQVGDNGESDTLGSTGAARSERSLRGPEKPHLCPLRDRAR